METDDRGFAHLADDGVLRSYAADGTVLEATPFSNAQIRALIDTRPPVWEPYRDELLRMFADIDGHQGEGMKHDVLLDPPVNLKPALRKHSEISAHRSANPLFLVKANINKKPQLWCLGQICSSHEGCRIMGCNACIFVDALISKVKTCR
ncbi:hypothetical protein CERZMDRAFT_52888 [Cercospora zeae-maydis SCOH1-5]|uniref:Uncharacterized protein n=1 Tax=Cercospora zeae-maydis SCOH1-5 TaxID=717836 RepID=A0A6A6EY07_9PEZI|nr:hypothetical protein CERZMDRAFT_52888 [Cercospora zeae-maydis SCOH1-5]